jgi:DNA-nicking Smr family endonuclease
MTIEQDIDRLYQLPLAEFIAERNALVKRGGADAGRVKAFEKPNAAAWAVNQIYWRDRRLYDAVVKTATRSRKAHSDALTGKKTDVPFAEAAHAAAVRDAVDRGQALLRQFGDAATESTMAAVRETLNALPVDEAAARPGRLTRPIEAAVGFGALGDLLRGAAIRPAATAEVVRFSAPVSKKAKDRVDPAEQRAKDEAAAALRELTAKKQALESSLKTARASLAAMEEDRRDVAARLEKIDAGVKRLGAEVEQLTRELQSVERPTHSDSGADDFARAMADVVRLPPDPRSRVRATSRTSPLTTGGPSKPAAAAQDQDDDDAGSSGFAANGVDRRELRKLKRGDYLPGDRLDLHRMTAAEAVAAVKRLIERSRSRHRCICIVHGRGLHSEGNVAVLKSRVRESLRQNGAVLAFSDAPVADGGAGAVYVLLRK